MLTRSDITYMEPRTKAHVLFMLYRYVTTRGPQLDDHLLSTSKLLTRNTFSSPDVAKSDIAIAQVNALNLITSDVTHLEDMLDTIVAVFTTQLELVLGGIYVWQLLGECTNHLTEAYY